MCDPDKIKREKSKVNPDWLIRDNVYKCPHCEFTSSKTGICNHIFLSHTKEGVELKKIKYASSEIKNKMGWSRGLTKETDERVRLAAEKQKEMIASGEIKIHWQNKRLSSEHKAKLSEAQTNVLNSKELSNNFAHVKYYKCKNIDNVQYSMRGTFELKLAIWLNSKQILWTKNNKLNYLQDNIKRTYLPDFYLPKYDIYLETKGYYPEKDQTKMRLVLEQNKINLKLVFKETIEKLEKIENLFDLLKLI